MTRNFAVFKVANDSPEYEVTTTANPATYFPTREAVLFGGKISMNKEFFKKRKRKEEEAGTNSKKYNGTTTKA